MVACGINHRAEGPVHTLDDVCAPYPIVHFAWVAEDVGSVVQALNRADAVCRSARSETILQFLCHESILLGVVHIASDEGSAHQDRSVLKRELGDGRKHLVRKGFPTRQGVAVVLLCTKDEACHTITAEVEVGQLNGRSTADVAIGMLGEYIGSITHAVIVSVAHQEQPLEVVAAHAKAIVCFLAVISFVETNLRSAEAG